MTQETTDKIRQIIRDQYGCDDTFTPASTLTGTILDGDYRDAIELKYRIEEELAVYLENDDDNWQTVQDVFDSVEAAINE